MDPSRIYTKTSRGILDSSLKASALTREHGRLLALIDGKSSVSDLLEQNKRLSENRLAAIIDELVAGGFIRLLSAKSEQDEELGFSSTIIVDESNTQAFFEAQAAAENQMRRSEDRDARAKAEAREALLKEVSADIAAEAAALKLQDSQQRAQAATAPAAAKPQPLKSVQGKPLQPAEKTLKAAPAAMQAARAAEKSAENAEKGRLEKEAAAVSRRELEAKIRTEEEAQRNADMEARLREMESAKIQAQNEVQTLSKALNQARVAAELENRVKRRLEARAREEAETRERLEAEAAAKLEAERKARIEAEEKAQAEAAARAKAEAEAQARLEAEKRAAEAARVRAEEEARRQSAEEARRQAEAESEAKLEAERQARRAAEERARAEAEARAKAEAEAQALLEAEKRAAEEARRAEEEARRQAELEAERRARNEAEEKARLEAEKRAAEEARQAAEMARRQAEAEAEAKLEAERRARMEAEKALAEAEAQARQEAEKRAAEEALARAAAEARRQAEEAAVQERLLAEQKARAEAEQRAQAEAVARAEAEALAQQQARELAQRQAEAEALAAAAAEEAVRQEAEADKRKIEEQQRAAEVQRVGEAAARALEEERQARAKAEMTAQSLAQERAQMEQAAKARELDRQRAREEANAKARAEMEEALHRAEEEKECEAREEARLREEAEARAQAAAKAANLPFLTGRKRKPFRFDKKMAKTLAATVAALLVLGVALAHVLTFGFYIPTLERQLTQSLGQRVAIQDLHFSSYPMPHWDLDGVTIGDGAGLRIAKARLFPTLAAWFSDTKVVQRVEIEGLSLAENDFAALSAWRKRQLRSVPMQFEHLQLKDAKFSHPLLDVFNFNAAVDLRRGRFAQARIQSSDQRFNINLLPQGETLRIELDATKSVMPFEPRLPFDSLKVLAELREDVLMLNTIDAQLLDGYASGTGEVGWTKGWNLKTDLELKQIAVEPGLARFTRETKVTGTLEAKLRVVTEADALENFFAAPQVQATFRVKNGEYSGIDLVRAIQAQSRGGNIGGKTHFTDLSGYFQYAKGRYQYRQLKLQGGVVSASGNLEIDPEHKLSGNLLGDLQTKLAKQRMAFVFSGNLGAPVLKLAVPSPSTTPAPQAPVKVVDETKEEQ